MAKSYTSLLDVINDNSLYLADSGVEAATLAMVPPVAKNRWDWIVKNWDNSLFPRFKLLASGDQDLEAALVDLDQSVTSYKIGNNSNALDSTSNYEKFYTFINDIKMSELTLTPEENIFYNNEIQRVGLFEVEDFRAMISFVGAQIITLEQTIGLGDPDAAKLAGVTVQAKKRNATIDDMEKLGRLQQIKDYIYGIVFELQGNTKRPPDLVRQSNQDVDPNSKVSFFEGFLSGIPVPFEISLENMAKKYLGNRNLWYELVTINNLQPPYVDEVGTKFPFIAPPAINNVIISADRKDAVPVGTKIGIGSYRYKEESRIVEKRVINENNTITLFLSGAQNINKFKANEGGFIRIFEPHTTRNGEFLLIPLTVSSPGSGISRPTPSADALRRLTKPLLDFGVDIQVDELTNDLMIDASGNFRFASGLINVRQAVKNVLRTSTGELPFHEKYGINESIGDKFFGSTDEGMLVFEAISRAILRDSRFKSFKLLELSTTGTSVSISVLVSIEGLNQPIPLTFIA
jgi:hypothetical protein